MKVNPQGNTLNRVKRFHNLSAAILAFTLLSMITLADNSSIGVISDLKYPSTLIIEEYRRDWSFISADPGTSCDIFGDGLIDGIYESLVTHGPHPDSFLGELASEWVVSPDRLSITFTIEPGHFFVLPETGINTNIKINAWIMKYSIDRAVILTDYALNSPNSLSASQVLRRILPGGDYQYSSLPSSSPRIDWNMSEAIFYLANNAIEVVNDWEIKIYLDYQTIDPVSIFSWNAGVAVNPYWIASNIPLDYTIYKGINDNEDNKTGMLPLDLWFPSLGGDFTKLGFPQGWNKNLSGVVPSTGLNYINYHEAMSRSGCGSGPYYLIESETTFGQEIKLRKNTFWEGFPAGQTNECPEEILIKYVNEENTRLLDLTAGECDLADISTSAANRLIDLEIFQENGSLQPLIDGVIPSLDPSMTIYALGINQNDRIYTGYLSESPSSTYKANEWTPYRWSSSYFSNNRSLYNNPFANYKFRQAFLMTFNAEAYINEQLHGFGKVLQGCIPQNMSGHHETLIEEGFQPVNNPPLAKAIFEELGWQGVITCPYNEFQTIQFDILSHLQQSIEALDVNISLNLQKVSWPTYMAIYRSLPLNLVEWTPPYPTPEMYFEPFYREFASYLNYRNPLLTTYLEALGNESHSLIREVYYSKIEELAARDHPFIPLYQEITLSVRRSWVQGDYESGLHPLRDLCQPWERIKKQELSTEVTEPSTPSTVSTYTSVSTTHEDTTSSTPVEGTQVVVDTPQGQFIPVRFILFLVTGVVTLSVYAGIMTLNSYHKSKK